MWKILIVDPVRVRRDGFVALLQADPRFVEVTGVRPEEVSALASRDSQPHVIILSARSSYSRSVLAAVRAAVPHVRVIALGVPSTGAEVVSYLEDGFSGYVPVDSTIEELCAAVHAAARDELVCAPDVAFALLMRVQELRSGWERSRDLPHLTRREQEILELLELGLSNKEIARRLSIRALTVKNHVHHILKKLGARRRGEAAARHRRRAADPPRGPPSPTAGQLP